MTGASRLSLQSVRIRNFRGYGKDFVVNLPSPQGVLLLSGANGLGKTSFFEAIEWALTGSVRRLATTAQDPASARDLVRKSSDATARVGVTLSSSEGDHEIIERSISLFGERGSPVQTGTPIEQVASVLSQPDTRWAVTAANLAQYLFLTHIHPQSAALRLIARGADERWSWVSQLAGTERFETIRRRVIGTKTGLTQLANDCVVARDQAKAAQSRWGEDRQSYERLKDRIATLDHAIDPLQCTVRLADVLSSLSAELRSSLNFDLNEYRRPELAVSGLRDALDRTRAAATHTDTQLRRLRELVDEWSKAQGELASQASIVAAIGVNKVTIDGRLIEAEAGLPAFREVSLRQKERTAQARARFERLRVVRTASEQLNSTGDLIAERVERVLALAGARERLEQAARDAEVALNQRHELENAVHRARKTRGDVDAAQKQLAAWVALEEERRARTVNGALLAEQAIALRATLVAAEKEATNAAAAARQAQADLLVAQRTAAAIDRAVAAIAAHIDEHSSTCPVCKSEFAEGELRRLAMESASAVNPSAASAEAEAAAHTRGAAETEAERQRLLDALKKLASEEKSNREILADISKKISDYERSAIFRQTTLDGAPGLLERMRVDADAELLAAEEGQRNLELEEVLSARLIEAKNAAARGRADLESAQRALDAVQGQRAESKASLVQLSELGLGPDATVGEIDAAIIGAAEVAQRADAIQAEADSRLNFELQAVQALRDELAAATANLRSARTQHEQAAARCESVANRWLQAGMLGQPSNAALDERIKIGAERLHELESCAATTERIAQGLKAWSEATELRSIEERLSAQASPGSLDEHAKTLELTLATAEQALQNATRAREAADALGNVLKERTSEFNNRVLQPVQQLFWRYLAALVHDERFHEINLATETSARSGSLHFRLSLGDWQDDGTEAERVLSEGQLAELSLAALLAASSAYRWSRWRALLLDDPTQYNDLIHATAFFEVIRNLVHFEKYQVVLSTHDSQQSTFLRRKLEGMNVPCVECRYHGQGPDGVDYTIM
jgi:DNA repair exonuclease SbcCD ATPase subunit